MQQKELVFCEPHYINVYLGILNTKYEYLYYLFYELIINYLG